jgi:hypothetical protein
VEFDLTIERSREVVQRVNTSYRKRYARRPATPASAVSFSAAIVFEARGPT